MFPGAGSPCEARSVKTVLFKSIHVSIGLFGCVDGFLTQISFNRLVHVVYTSTAAARFVEIGQGLVAIL